MAQYRGGASFSPRILPQFTGANDVGSVSGNDGGPGGGDQFNMQAPSPVVNQGGPGNPNGASNMPKVPVNYWKGPAYDGGGINPQTGRQMMPRGPMPQFDPGLMERMRMGGSRQGMSGQGGNQAPPGYYEQGRARQQQDWNNLPPEERARYDQATQQQMGGGQDPFNQYGNAGQSPQLGRYVPPMMGNPNDVNNAGWTGGGGYSYNIPNSYGSPQWNQFNSTDRANPGFGQSPGISGGGQGRGYNYPPMPQFNSPYARPDQQRSQQYQQYMMSLAQGQQPQGQAPQGASAPQPVPNNPSMTVMPQLQSNPY